MAMKLHLSTYSRKFRLLKNSTQKNRLSFNDFYPLEAVARENKGLKLMSMEDILQQTDFFVDRTTGEPLTPPQNRTDWNGVSKVDIWELHRWLRSVGSTPYWSHKKCIVDFSPDLQRESYPMSRRSRNQPTPVNGSSTLRLAEVLAHRTKVCMYDREWQAVKVIHFTVDNASGTRLLIHFYAFLFSSDWTMDLWIKRFARDHLRYVDEIQCAAARIVAELRRLSPNNAFDTFHIRRGDFKGWVRLSANEIYSNIEDVLTPNSSIYIATDEMNRSYFEPFFAAAPSLLLERLSTPDTRSQHQLPRSRRTTRCCSWSPLRRVLFFHLFQFCESTARRYYSTRDKLPGYAEGTLPTSYYYAPLRKKNAMHSYKRLSRPFNGREFPVAWKNIDLNLESNVSTTVAKN
jgi:hypothetical protein